MSEFTAKIVAELDTSKVEQKIKQLENRNIKINADGSNAQKNINSVNNSIKSAQQNATGFGNTLKKSLNIGTAAAITATGFRLISTAAKDAVEAVKGFDDAILNLRMATNDSYNNVQSLVKGYNEMGKSLGATTTEVSDSADAWLRQGNSIKNTNLLIKDSMMLSKIANIDAADSTQYLTSAMKGYKVAVEDVANIVDKLTSVDLVSATDAGGLAEAMSRTAVTADMAGVSMDRLLGYLATVGEVTQKSMSSVGESFKTIFARMSDIKANKLELIDEDGTTQLLSDVELTLKNVGIDLRSTVTEFDNYGDVLDKLAGQWDSLGSVQQAAIAKAFAGVRQQENFKVLMENYDSAKKYMEVAAESAGTAEEKFGAYLDSIEAKTKTLQATFESLAVNTFTTELAGDLIDASTAVLKFLDETNLLKGALTGLAVAGAIKGFTTLATGISNAAIKMNQFNAALKVVKAGNIGEAQIEKLALMTSNLSENQLKAVLASKALSTQQRLAILTAQGMSTAEAEATLASMGLATAEGAATATAFSLSGALKGLWATLMANPLILVIAAVTAAVSIFSSYQQELKEAREASLQAGESAKEEAENIRNLYSAYKEADLAYRNNAGSKEELESATDSLLSALGIEESKLEELIQKYGSLDKAISKVTVDALKDKLSDLTSGYKAVQEDLLDATKDGWFSSFSLVEFGHNKDTIKFADTLKNAGLIDSGSYGSAGGAVYIGDNGTVEGVMEVYDNLQAMKKALEDKIGESYTREELAESDLYNSINDKVNSFKEQYENVLDYVNQMNDLSAEIAYNEYIGKNGVPETQEEFNALKKSITETAKSSGEFVGNQKQIQDAVTDTLATIPELKQFYENVGEAAENTNEIIIQTAADLTEVIKSAKEFSDGLSKIQSVLNEQSTGNSISAETFNSAELADYTSALEYHNGVLQLNRDKVNEIIKARSEEEIQTNNTNKAIEQSKYLENAAEIERLREKISEKNYAEGESASSIQDNIDALLAENSALKQNCDTYDLMNNSITEATSAYQNFLNAQSAAQSGEMFDGALQAVKKINDTLNVADSDSYGRIGNEDYKAALDFVIPNSVDSSDEQAINSYLDSVKSMFTLDDKGNYTGLNIAEFCNQAVQEGLMVIDEESDEYKIAGQKTMQDFADGLRLSLPLVQAMFGEMEEFGGEFDWADEATKTMGDLGVAANEAAESLRNIEGNEDLKISMNVSDFEDAELACSTLDATIEEMNTLKAQPGVDTSQIDQANTVIQYCIAQKQMLEMPAIMSVDTSQVNTGIGDAIAKLKEFQAAQNNLEMQAAVGADTSDAQEKVNSLVSEINGLDTDIKVSLGLDDTTSVDGIKSAISNLDTEAIIKLGIDKSLIDGYEAPEKKAEVKFTKDSTIPDKYQPEDKAATVTYNCVHTAVDLYNPDNLTRTVTYNIKTNGSVPSGTQKANGSAHAAGTAKASGDWRTITGGQTLVGELGQEIVVDPRTGKWYTVGDNGAEFRDIPKGAIVFNHLQSKALLENGYVDGRAVALASGTAMVRGGIKIPQSKKPTTSQNTKNANTKSAGNNSNTSNTAQTDKTTNKPKDNKEDKALEKFKKWFSKLFDWIEIRLERQSKKIDRYLTKAENASGAGKYKDAAKNYRQAIISTATQISYEQTAASKYNKHGNKVLNKAVSSGIVSKKAADSIKKQVQNGSMNIKKYSERVQEVIKDYSTWYNKSQDAKDAITELHNKIRTYISDLKELRDTQRDAKLDSISTFSSIGTSGVANSTRAKNSQLNYTNSQLAQQNKAYDTEVTQVTNDTNAIGKKGTKVVKKALKSKDAKKNKKYKKALQNAQKAIKAKKPVASADLKTIKSKSISVYNNLYAYNLALENVETAKLEQAANYAATSAEVYKNIAEKYSNKDDATNNKINLLRQKSSNTTSSSKKNCLLAQAAAQYDNILKNDDAEIAEYSKAVASNRKTVTNKAGTTSKYKKLDSKTKKAVMNAIKAAKSAVKSKKSIPASTISSLAKYYSKGYITKAFYEGCVSYNDALESLELAKEQRELDVQEAIAEKAAIGTEMVNNVEQQYTNKLNDNANKTRKIQTLQSVKTARGLSLGVSDYQSLINQSKADQALYSQAAAAISAQIQANLAAGYWTTDSQEYKDAIQTMNDYSNRAEECRVEQEEWNNAIADIPYSNLEKALDLLDSIKSNYESMLKINAAKGMSETATQFTQEIANANAEIAKYTELRNQAWVDYQKALSNTDGTYGGKTADEWLAEYYNYDTTINNLTADVVELNNAIANLPFDTIEKALDLLDSISSYDSSVADLKTALGLDLSENDYVAQIADNNDKLTQLEKERLLAHGNYLKALADADGVYGGKTAQEWLAEYNDYGTEINKTRIENETLKDSLRDDVYWRTFERAHESAQRFKNLLSGLADLISDDMYFDKDGRLTEYGVTQVATLVGEYENARQEVQNYQNDIANLNSLYAQGYYTQDEYNEKLNELQTELLGAASSMKDYSDSIVNMYKNTAQAELDAVFDLIDARNDALSAKKKYYEYDKTIKDSTKDIQTLQAEMAALEGIDDAASKAKRAMYEAQLQETQDKLNDTVNEHMFDLSQDALTELKNTLQGTFDDKWDAINGNLDELTSLMASANLLTEAAAGTINSTLNELLKHYGIDPVSSGIGAAYASGTRSVPKNIKALTNESGNEILVTKQGMITPLEQGDGVLPSYLTNRLYDLALNGVPMPNLNMPEISVNMEQPKASKTGDIYIDNIEKIIDVEGNADESTVNKLKKLSDDMLNQAYEYTSQKIYKDYLHAGGKRSM